MHSTHCVSRVLCFVESRRVTPEDNMYYCAHSLPPPTPGCHYVFIDKGDYEIVLEALDQPVKKKKNEKETTKNISPPKKSKKTADTVAMETEENDRKVRHHNTTSKKSVQS